MKIKIKKEKNLSLEQNEINIIIEYSLENEYTERLENYIQEFEQENTQILVQQGNTYLPILKKDIIVCYSEKKVNYCRTNANQYKIRSKLYEIEKMDKNFIRISKSCIANIKHIQCFDLSYTGRIIVKFDDNTQEYVARRRVRDILEYLDERRI
ncbi:MAG: LytTR family DNA-binding domain-containing protein [Clostridia bacterium]